MSEYRVSILSKMQRDALLSGASVLIDELFRDFISISNGEAIEDHMALADCLPQQFRQHYNALFVKKFITCVIRVADRLASWEDGEIPASTAECMALRSIIENAEVWLEIKDGRHTAKDFSIFEDIAFPDFDIELLFDPALDGIENTRAAKHMGMALIPSEWFKETYAPVHPYVCDGERTHEG